MQTIPQSNFQTAYDRVSPPWDIPGPQPALVRLQDNIAGKLLDSGCGTGENGLYFAERGCDVTGFDLVPLAIERAKAKGAERNLNVEFLVKDALSLESDSIWQEQFDNIIDSGVFHVFSNDDMRIYAKGLHRVLKPGGHLYIICFSTEEPGTHGPRRIPKELIYEIFSEGWEIESVEPSRYHVRPEFDGSYFSAGGPKAWFAAIRKD